MNILELKNVALELGGKHILNGVTADIEAGRVYALVGPNGAGKSTLANTIMGLPGYTEFDGELTFEGRSLRGVPIDERGKLGITMSWQEPARFEGLRLDRFIGAGAREKTRENLEAALERVGLDPARYLTRKVDKTLSGGERKRVELASILVMKPRLVVMDEPDSGIDVEALTYIFGALDDFREMGAAVLMITHSLTVLDHAESAFLLCDGRVVDEGPVARIREYFTDRCLPCSHKNKPSPEEVGDE